MGLDLMHCFVTLAAWRGKPAYVGKSVQIPDEKGEV